MKFTKTQQQRIIELDMKGKYANTIQQRSFASPHEREDSFKKIEEKLVKENKDRLANLSKQTYQSSLRRLEFSVVKLLNELEFIEVITPIKLAKGNLEKMGINEEDPLWQQIYWVDDGKYCLRPMLAPNLYYLLSRFERVLSNPIKIFEVGTCFRKESRGSKHLSEFTMLNLVELEIQGNSEERLKFLIEKVMNGLEIDYEIEEEDSAVYGKTIDIIVDGTEVGSAAIGPHPLDSAWNITGSWVGVGFGLERLVMCREGFNNIKRIGRSLIYQDGVRLNI
jgi:phenylalanyl-tRNA synthetase alpha chain